MDVCHKDESGQLPGKTIVFAMTQEHALRLADVFEEMYPQYPDLAAGHHLQDPSTKGTLIENFKKENQPRIAISVDMLETGVNVPEVVNLVFMRPVHSRIKLEQMIGRGTRTHETCKHPDWLPDGHKDDFLIIDFWENDFNKPAPGGRGPEPAGAGHPLQHAPQAAGPLPGRARDAEQRSAPSPTCGP